jgi:hypothetical protein
LKHRLYLLRIFHRSLSFERFVSLQYEFYYIYNATHKDDLHQFNPAVLIAAQTIILAYSFHITLICLHEFLEWFLAAFPIWTHH